MARVADGGGGGDGDHGEGAHDGDGGGGGARVARWRCDSGGGSVTLAQPTARNAPSASPAILDEPPVFSRPPKIATAFAKKQ